MSAPDAPRVFVSHSHKDDEFTERLVTDLHDAGAEVWVDEANITHGSFLEEIDDALRRCEWMVLVLTPNAVASGYVRDEVYAALTRRRHGYMRDVIPVLAAQCQPGTIPPQWDALHRYDATSNYETALKGLLNALGLAPTNTAASPPPTQQDEGAPEPGAHSDRSAYVRVPAHMRAPAHVSEPVISGLRSPSPEHAGKGQPQSPTTGRAETTTSNDEHLTSKCEPGSPDLTMLSPPSQRTKWPEGVLVIPSRHEVVAKICYVGTLSSGKAGNLEYIRRIFNPREVQEMECIETLTERTLHLKLLPLDLYINRFAVRFDLWSLPGGALDAQTRTSLLKGAACVVFVVDSRASKLEDNVECWGDLVKSLRQLRREPSRFPIILQWNRRNEPDALPLSTLEEHFNPYGNPSFEASPEQGKGVVETLRVAVNMVLRSFPSAKESADQ